jgi:hypothetical protein
VAPQIATPGPDASYRKWSKIDQTVSADPLFRTMRKTAFRNRLKGPVRGSRGDANPLNGGGFVFCVAKGWTPRPARNNRGSKAFLTTLRGFNEFLNNERHAPPRRFTRTLLR